MAFRRVVGVASVVALTALLARPADAEERARLVMLDAHNQPLTPGDGSLGISQRITHDSSLPRKQDANVESSDPDNFRLELEDAQLRADVVYATVQSVSPSSGERHGLLRHVPLVRVPGTHRFRSPFLRLVSDSTDESAPDVGMQVLRARVGDTVTAVRTNESASATLSVGSTSSATALRVPLRGTLRLLVLRMVTGGPPVLGDNDAEAMDLARGQVEIANEIWAQCFIDFGEPRDAFVQVVDPPPPALLAIGDLDGLPASGGGAIQFLAGTKKIGPIPTVRGALPEQTAAAVVRHLRAQGFQASVSVNPRADFGAHPSADVVVRDRNGLPVALSSIRMAPLTTDKRQRVQIGGVDLSDGVSEFDNTIAPVGTLEERTLIKLLADADPATVDVLLVNRFVNRDRQGEAFIEADGSSMANTLIFDRNAVRYERQAWVQAHELGHVLLDEPLHPDNVGPDRPWLLMDADARQGRVVGPKRLTLDECAKARRRSGPGAHPTLLKPVNARPLDKP